MAIEVAGFNVSNSVGHAYADLARRLQMRAIRVVPTFPIIPVNEDSIFFGLHETNPFGVNAAVVAVPSVRSQSLATLDFVAQPLRGNESIAI